MTQQAKEDAAVQYVSARAMLSKLVTILRNAVAPRPVSLEAHDTPLRVRQASALALVVNEMVSNSLKHGAGEVSIVFSVADGMAQLEVCDEGEGFPTDFDPQRAGHTGLELMETAARWDLAGTISYSSRSTGGARVMVRFALSPTS
jgi:two-component sensor histidine kinase